LSQAGQSKTARDVITLFRIAQNLKLVNYLFLEFSLNISDHG
jgi:hypothetical protein